MDGYFDYASATPVNPDVLTVMMPYYSEQFYNPSALYKPAREAKKALNDARASIAYDIGAKPVEIIFTAGATEANNIAIHGVMKKFPGKHLLTSNVEHDSVRETAYRYNYSEAEVRPDGVVDATILNGKINDDTVLISVMLANNEIGTVQPIKQIVELVKQVRLDRTKSGNNTPLYVHTDAAQAANYVDVHVHRLGVDLMTLNGGKIYGPKQSGILYVRGDIVLEPLLSGGGQERGLRSGTENIAHAVGFSHALKLACKNRKEESQRMQQLQKILIEALQATVPNIQINGSLKHRLPNNVHVTVDGQDNERLLMLLDGQGFYAAAGSACSASSEEPSHVLAAIGLDAVSIRSSIRISMGSFTKEDDVRKLVQALASHIA